MEDVWEEFPDVINTADAAWSRDAYRAAQAEANRFDGWAAGADPAVAEAATKLLAWFPAGELLAGPATDSDGSAKS